MYLTPPYNSTRMFTLCDALEALLELPYGVGLSGVFERLRVQGVEVHGRREIPVIGHTN